MFYHLLSIPRIQTLNSESEDEDTQTVNDDKAIPSDHPHPGKLMFMTLRLLLISALTDWKRLLSSIPMLQQTCLYIHYPCFLKLWNFEKQQNVLDCTTLLLAILASEETELQEKALVLQPNSCMGRSDSEQSQDSLDSSIRAVNSRIQSQVSA
ncbi:hypothetical protein D5086_032906 [Populus alba]|uniref:Uncharacterized protein n=1 Tax=Populus alba TaxID=43335 RepID=A0ACC4AFD1_POPAL